jgi:hypothetical protein
MEAIFLQIFVSFGLVLGSLLLFAFSARQRDVEHADRLALFPIEEESTRPHAPEHESTSKKEPDVDHR